ncbi:MAG: OmpA family protein [Gemmatimonadota bacterium]
MRQKHLSVAAGLAAILMFVAPVPAEAQIGGLGNAAKRAAKKQVDKVVKDKVRCAFDDRACIDNAKQDGDDVEIVDADGNVMDDDQPADAQAPGEEPGQGVWRNYDFVPGTDVWFALDLSNERIGRFPASQLEFGSGNAQVVELDGEYVLEFAANTTFYVNLPDQLPEDYSIEFMARTGAPNMATSVFVDPVSKEGIPYQRYENQYLRVYRLGGVYFQGYTVSSTDGHWEIAEEFVPIKFQVDGDYAIMYMGDDRVSNVPNAKFVGSNTIEFQVTANSRLRSYLKDIVIAVGLDDLYGTISGGEPWTTRGILFDVDSDVLRPESTPVLDQIRRTMTQHGDLSIVIEGHTDSTGDDAHNQDLSERRAQSVVRWLEGQGIDASRMTAAGKGETEPVADNATLEGRQENRRVVIRQAS